MVVPVSQGSICERQIWFRLHQSEDRRGPKNRLEMQDWFRLQLPHTMRGDVTNTSDQIIYLLMSVVNRPCETWLHHLKGLREQMKTTETELGSIQYQWLTFHHQVLNMKAIRLITFANVKCYALGQIQAWGEYEAGDMARTRDVIRRTRKKFEQSVS